jgi:hypothetical protein
VSQSSPITLGRWPSHRVGTIARHHQCRGPRDDLDRLAEATDPSVSAQAFGDRSDHVPHSQQCGHRSRRAAQVPVTTMMDDIRHPDIR